MKNNWEASTPFKVGDILEIDGKKLTIARTSASDRQTHYQINQAKMDNWAKCGDAMKRTIKIVSIDVSEHITLPDCRYIRIIYDRGDGVIFIEVTPPSERCMPICEQLVKLLNSILSDDNINFINNVSSAWVGCGD